MSVFFPAAMKAGMVGSLNSIPQQLYPHSHGAPGHPAPGHSLSPPNSHGAPIHTLTPPHHHSHPSPPSQMPGKNPYSMYNNGEPPKLNHMPTTGPGGPMAPGGPVVTMPQVTPDVMQQHYSRSVDRKSIRSLPEELIKDAPYMVCIRLSHFWEICKFIRNYLKIAK